MISTYLSVLFGVWFSATALQFLRLHAPGVVTTVENFLAGTWMNVQVQYHRARFAAICFTIVSIVWTAICIALVVLGLVTGFMPIMIAGLILEITPLFVIGYVFLTVSELSGGVSQLAWRLGEQQVPLTNLPDRNQDDNFFTYGVKWLSYTAVNSVRFPFALLWDLLLAMVNYFAEVMCHTSQMAKWLARVVALTNLYLLALTSVAILQLMTGVEVFTIWTGALLLLILISFLSIGIMLDWKIGMKGMPSSGTVMAVIAFVCFGVALLALVAPDKANGVGMVLQNFSVWSSKRVNVIGVSTLTSNHIEYALRQDLYYNRDLFKKDADGNFLVAEETLGKYLPSGKQCISLGPSVQVDRSTPEPMIELYCPDQNDPRRVLVKTNTKNRFWIPASAVVETNKLPSAFMQHMQ